MSTRGVYGFRYRGQDKLTYSHTSSHPRFLGACVLEFILDTKALEFWRGLQTEPDGTNRRGAARDDLGYYPCRLLGALNFRLIREESVKTGINIFTAWEQGGNYNGL